MGLMANQPGEVYLRNNNQAILNHRLNRVRSLRDFLFAVNHRNHDGHVAGDAKEALFMRVALHSVAHDAAINGGAGNIHHVQAFHNRVVERLVVPAVRFAQIDAQQLGLCPCFSWAMSRSAFFSCRTLLMTWDLLHLDHPVRHHLVKCGEHFLDLSRPTR